MQAVAWVSLESVRDVITKHPFYYLYSVLAAQQLLKLVGIEELMILCSLPSLHYTEVHQSRLQFCRSITQIYFGVQFQGMGKASHETPYLAYSRFRFRRVYSVKPKLTRFCSQFATSIVRVSEEGKNSYWYPGPQYYDSNACTKHAWCKCHCASDQVCQWIRNPIIYHHTPNYRSRGEIPKILKLAWGKAFVEVVAMWRLACV